MTTPSHTLTRLDVATVEGLASAISLTAHTIGTRAKFMQDFPNPDYSAAGFARAQTEFTRALATVTADIAALAAFLAGKAN